MSTHTQVIHVDINTLTRNPLNPTTRQPDAELVNSIRVNGILNPILVRKNLNTEGYTIISGERRYAALTKLNRSTAPVIVIHPNSVTDEATLLLVDNIHRKNMNLVEENQVIVTLLKDRTIPAVAKLLNKSVHYVARRAGIANLIPEIKKDITRPMFVTGLTDRTAFIFSRLPAKVQKQVWESSTETYKAGKDRILHRVYDTPSNIEATAQHHMQKALALGNIKAEDATSYFATTTTKKLKKTGAKKALDGIFKEEDTEKTAIATDELKAYLKELKDTQKLSEGWSGHDNVLSQSDWRLATQSDNPKTIHEGVIVSGKGFGKFVNWVKQEKTVSGKPTTQKTLSPKQQEAKREERRETILNNKATRAGINLLLKAMIKKAPELTPQEMGSVIKKHCNRGARDYFRAVFGEDVYKELSDKKKLQAQWDTFAGIDWGHFFLFQHYANDIQHHYEETAKHWGIDWKTIHRQEKERITTETLALKVKKEAEKAQRTGKVGKRK